MPQHSQVSQQKNKDENKPKVEHSKPESTGEQSVDLPGVTVEAARRVAVQPGEPSSPGLPADSSNEKPRLTTIQMAQLQRMVGNQATRQMLRTGVSAQIQLEPLSDYEKRQIQEAQNQPKGEFKEEYEGYILTPDEAALEKILRAVIAGGGFDAARKFINGYGLRTPPKPEQRETHDKVMPILEAKLEDLRVKGKEYAETTFYNAAVANLEQILADSEKTVKAESEKYGRSYTQEKTGVYHGEPMYRPKPELTNEQNTAEMATAAKDIVERQKKIDDLNKKRESYEEDITAYPDTGRDRGFSLPAPKVVGKRIKDPEAHKQAIEDIKKEQNNYDIARQDAEIKFPILASFRPPAGLSQLKTIAEGDKENRDSVIVNDIEEKLKNIAEIKGIARDGKFVYKQGSILHATKKSLGVQAGSVEDYGINAKAESVAESEMLKNLGLALVSLVAGALLAIPTGGASVAASAGAAAAGAAGGAALAAASVYTMYEGIREYQVEKAAAGTNFDKAKAISQTDPSMFWLAVNIVGAIADLGAAAQLFTRAVQAVRAIGKLEDATEAARAAYRSAGLSGVMGEEEFVQQFLRNMAQDAEALAAKVKARSGLMESLKDASNPNTKALVAGDQKAIQNLVKQHGKWEQLVGELQKGTPEMQQIAGHVVKTREGIIADLKKMLDFGETEGTRHPTSDYDINLPSDETVGAGEKLMKAETYMSTKYGPGWDEAWRINFYVDLKSRLLIPDEIMQGLSEAEKAQLLIKQSQMATKYNMARRLQAAQGNPQATMLIEQEAIAAGADLGEIRKLAAVGEDAAKLERNKLLLQADALEAQIRTATGPRKVELYKQLQAKQMEANFYTKEAVISPGAALELTKAGKAQGIQLADSMLEWTAMLEHKVAEYGTVTQALKEYEPWKYIDRIAAQAQQAAIDENLMSRLNSFRARAANIVPSEVRSEEWAKEAGHLGGEAALDQKNRAVYSAFLADMRKLGSDIRASEMKKLEAAAGTQ